MRNTPESCEEILKRGEGNRKRYTAFLLKLKKSRKLPLEKMFAEADSHAFSEIDCLECGRCCTNLGPRLRETDISRLAARERLKPSAYMDLRLKKDEDGDMVFSRMPCPYFGPDGYCAVYEDRPEACRDYPHMSRGRQKARISLHINNLNHCPAVVLAVEYLMEVL